MTRGRTTRRQFLRGTGGTVASGPLFCELTRPAHAQSGETWTQFGYNGANTGYAPDNTGPVDGIEKQWSFDTGDYVTSSPVVANDTVYIGNRENVYALDAEDGSEQWASQNGYGSPAVANGNVYIGSNDGVLCLDAASGTEQWLFETGGTISSPAVADGTVYFGSHDNSVYAVNAENGAELWAFDTGDYVTSSPAVAEGTVYVGNDGGSIYALDAADGTEQWVFNPYSSLDPSVGSPAVANGNVYFASRHRVYALDATDGTEQWSAKIGWSLSSPAVADGTVYFGTHNGLWAINAKNGEWQWTFKTGQEMGSPAVADSTVYAGHVNNRVYALDAADGTEQWAFEATGHVSSPVVANGTVYFGSNDNRLYALQAGEQTFGSAGILIPGIGIHLWPSQLGVVGGFFGSTIALSIATRWWFFTREKQAPGGDEPPEPDNESDFPSQPETEPSTDAKTVETSMGEVIVKPKTDPEPSAHSEANDRASKLVKRGDNHREEAREYRTAGEYGCALSAYDQAREAYQTALETIGEDTRANTEKIKQKLDKTEDDKNETCQQLQEEVESLRTDLDYVDTLADDKLLEEAKQLVADINSRLDSLTEIDSEHELDNIRTKIAMIKQRRNDLHNEIAALEDAEREPQEPNQKQGHETVEDYIENQDDINPNERDPD